MGEGRGGVSRADFLAGFILGCQEAGRAQGAGWTDEDERDAEKIGLRAWNQHREIVKLLKTLDAEEAAGMLP